MDNSTRQYWVSIGKPDPVKAYRQHAVRAGRRGIEFNLTFSQWWALWEPHYAARGTNTGQMCMCRTGDKGAYEIGNVRIDTVNSNRQEATQVQKARIRSSSDTSWFCRGNGKMAMGYFKMREIMEERESVEDFDDGY